MRKWLAFLLVLLAGCGGSTTRTRETGYKGKARLDAYLAATRFLDRMGEDVVNQPGWPRLDDGVSMLIAPASVLSTDAYVREVERWVADGGHLLCLVEFAESYLDDWGTTYRGGFVDFDGKPYPEPLDEWLSEVGLTLGHDAGSKTEAKRLKVDGESFEVFAESAVGVKRGRGARRVFGQRQVGDGLVSVLADARPFRNRYIGEHDHAALLLALAEGSPFEGSIVFVRDAGLSLWSMLWRHGWPALVGLLTVTLFWLWKNMPRFGPPRREEERNTMRDYDHHLEALGDFQWRLDKGAAMLRPLRDTVLERAQHLASAAHRDNDLFDWVGRRAGIPRERAERAMTHQKPADPASFTRVVSDLQRIHHSLS